MIVVSVLRLLLRAAPRRSSWDVRAASASSSTRTERRVPRRPGAATARRGGAVPGRRRVGEPGAYQGWLDNPVRDELSAARAADRRRRRARRLLRGGAMTYRVAVDIGGTFTDLVVVDEEAGRTTSGKVLSTPANPARGRARGAGAGRRRSGDDRLLRPRHDRGAERVSRAEGHARAPDHDHGLRDAYSIARHDRKELYALRYRKPERLVPRRDVLEVVERMRWDGTVETPLDETSLRPIVEKIGAEGVEAVAVCLVHSYVNPAHELQVREILRRECPGLSVTLSHEIAREWREYERAVHGRSERLHRAPGRGLPAALEGELERLQVASTLYVMQSNGGITTSRAARAAAGADAALRAGRRRRSAAPPWRGRRAARTSSASTWAARRSTSASSSTAARPSRPRPSSRACR